VQAIKYDVPQRIAKIIDIDNAAEGCKLIAEILGSPGMDGYQRAGMPLKYSSLYLYRINY
jgi:hypothetical protein